MNLESANRDDPAQFQRANRSRTGTSGTPNSPISGNQSSLSPPAISLPKGGGAIRGIGEKFAANPVSGTGSMSVPIATSPGRNGFGPQLSLTYDSGAGNGPFGFGWSLSLPSITRKTDKGLPRYLDEVESDVFLLSGAEDLVPMFKKDTAGNWVLEDGEHVIWEESRTIGADEYCVRRYQPRIEGLFARIERWTNVGEPSDVHWRSISSDNILSIYGKDANSRIVDPDDPRRIFSWLMCETRDDRGNAVVYTYKAEDGAGVDLTRPHERNRGHRDDARRAANRYLKRIRYGNQTPLLDETGRRPLALTAAQLKDAGWLFELVFDYGEHDAQTPTSQEAGEWNYRPDPFSSYRSGFEVRTARLCDRVLMFHHFKDEPGVGKDCMVRSIDFTYSHEQNPADARNPVYTFLLAITQTGYKRNGDGYRARSLPPVEFEYSQPIVQDNVVDVDDESTENLPVGLDGAAYRWTDLHGEGIPGILTEQAGAWFYKRNLGPISEDPAEAQPRLEAKFAPAERIALKPNLATARGEAEFMDLAGDGQPDLVVLDGEMPGLHEHDGKEGWQLFRPFTARLDRDMRDPNLKFVDLDGNGHADLLITLDDAFVWHASLAEAGFGPAYLVEKALDEEKGPRLVFADGTDSIYLADLNGDGLTDLARIRNGEVCYWPNLGYGRFGAKITMDRSPQFDSPDHFGQDRLRLADIDGSGTTDIIYLHRDGVRLYFNQSGNGWSAPRLLNVFPRLDDRASINAVDLLGNGTACLVWSSPLPGDAGNQMRYVDLMGGQKPHLLIAMKNNLGAETRVHYAPSTKFYLQDKHDGRPWITRLPFPVHVVERVEIYDRVSRNRFVTRYAYHHGYFDGEEREFRGFGMLEQWDTEEIGHIAPSDISSEDTNLDEASFIPPVLTRSWFHTGAYLDGGHISNYFAGIGPGDGEYYREPALIGDAQDPTAHALLLDDTVLPPELALAEEREACRALKGAMLRQEVYALDGSEEERHPYTVTEQNFTIRPLQPREDNRHAVFFTHPREAITFHYERAPADPRIGHQMTLEVDGFGNVLKSVSVGYGRRPGKSLLTGGDKTKQERPLLTYTETDVTNGVDEPDDYRTPLPCEIRTYELTGYEPSPKSTRFSFDDFVANQFAEILTAQEIAYEEKPDFGSKQRRPIERMRSLYRKKDLSGPLALGEIDTMALPYENYQLAFTPGLLAVYAPKVSLTELQAILADEGRYVDLDGDGRWWIPSGRVFYSPGTGDSPAQALSLARQHFFLPRRYRDPFHTAQINTETTLTYDAYDLLVTGTTDALGNHVGAIYDYRVLQPRLVTDPNGNQSAVAFDALGMVAGSALMGKANESGDHLHSFDPDPTAGEIDQFLADPKGNATSLLKDATTRIIYDLDRFADKGQPVYAATLARETHVSDPLPVVGLKIQVGFTYSDGFGREVQSKIQAEPGDAPAREANPTDPTLPAKLITDPVTGELILAHAEARWVGTGRTVYNNKGNPVKQYEPFFSSTHLFEEEPEMVETGVTPILFYDPVGRVIATLHPNHTYEKVVFDPWQQKTYDVNDTVAFDPRTDSDVAGYVAAYFEQVAPLPGGWETWLQHRGVDPLAPPADTPGLEADRKAAVRTLPHAGTPTIAHFDTLGRPFLTVAHNKVVCPDHDLNGTEDKFHTRVELDIEGNSRAVIDALGRTVMVYKYDMLGAVIHSTSMDAGERWSLQDVAGQPLRNWDSRGHTFRSEYDELHRPVRSFVTGADPQDPAKEILFGRMDYGEGQPHDTQLNLRTRVFRQYDAAGVITYTGLNPATNLEEAYDFKGNLLRSQRQLVADYKAGPDWSANPALEPEIFTASTTYDALNRPMLLIAPHSDKPGTRINVIQPTYNEANLLEQVNAWLNQGAAPTGLLDPDTASLKAVSDIDYNAKGQREGIVYGSESGTGEKVATTYDYDPLTFRLAHLQTLRGAERLQDLSYTYDPVGNITSIHDDAQQMVFFNNQVIEPHADYIYDAIYRLVRADGREHIGQTANNEVQHHPEKKPHYDFNDSTRIHLAHPHDGQAMRRYTELYGYDAAGNILKLSHSANGGSWTRHYEHAVDSNQLLSTSLPGDGPLAPYSAKYAYDAHGSMTSMPHLPLMEWDFQDQLQATSQQVVANGGTPETTYYVYSAGGQRVRKVTERQDGSRKAERISLAGFEVYRESDGSGSKVELERETLHLTDDTRRIALVETRTQGDDGTPTQLVRYQLGNHLGSASLELDDQAQIISYEEYYPYGSTSYQAMSKDIKASAKRYRYTGKERDEETGLYYYGARYYAPWLGRWTACDPSGISAGVVLYCYSFNRPTNLIDPNGREPEAPYVDPFVEEMKLLIGDTIIANERQAVEHAAKRKAADASYKARERASEHTKPKPSSQSKRTAQSIDAVSDEEIHRQKMDMLLVYDLPPDETGHRGEDYFSYAFVYGLKQQIYNPMKSWILDERPSYLDSEGNVQTVPFNPDRSAELSIALGQIAMFALPTPKGTANVSEAGSARELAEKLGEVLEQGGKGRALKHSPIEVLAVEGASPTAATPSATVYRALKESGVAERLGVELLEPPAKRLYLVSGGATVYPARPVTVHGGDMLRMDLISKQGAAAGHAIGETYSKGVAICDECSYGWDLFPGIQQVNPKSKAK